MNNNSIEFKKKYIKYKNKYIFLKDQLYFTHNTKLKQIGGEGDNICIPNADGRFDSYDQCKAAKTVKPQTLTDGIAKACEDVLKTFNTAKADKAYAHKAFKDACIRLKDMQKAAKATIAKFDAIPTQTTRDFFSDPRQSSIISESKAEAAATVKTAVEAMKLMEEAVKTAKETYTIANEVYIIAADNMREAIKLRNESD
jgi:hypothetical protein